MTCFVIDASVVVDLLARFNAAPIEDVIFASDAVVTAPALLNVEVLQTMRRLDRTGAIPSTRQNVVDDFRALRIQTYAHDILLDHIWMLRHNVSAYDAAYVALTHLLGGTLLTRDVRLARAAKGIEVLVV